MSADTDPAGAFPAVAEHKFRCSVLSLFVAFVLMVLPISLGFLLWKFGWEQWQVILLAGLAGAVVCLLVSLLFKLCFPIHVMAEGVRGYSAWGFPRSIRWRDVENVRTFRLLNLKYLRLYPRNQKRPVWIGLFLAEPERFREQVRAYAPPHDALARFLEPGS